MLERIMPATVLHVFKQFKILFDSSVSVRAVAKLGIRGKHVICMQGPFSEALNEAMFAQGLG